MHRAVVITVIFNPTARGEKAKSFLHQLAQLGDGVILRPTRFAGDAIQLASAAAESGAHTVVAAGGDGTVNEVVNGLARIPAVSSGRVRLGLLPWGTVNVFARELGIPFDFQAAWNVIRSGQPKVIDLLYADFQNSAGPQRRYFVQLGGAGLDSRALQLVSWSLKKKIGQLAYVWAGLRALLPPKPRVTLRMEAPDRTLRESSGELVLFGNGRLYGGRYPVFPNARMDDGVLDAMVMRKTTPWTLLRAWWLLKRGGFARCPDVEHLQAASMELSAPDGVPFELEGDNLGTIPVQLGVVPMALTVMTPGV